MKSDGLRAEAKQIIFSLSVKNQCENTMLFCRTEGSDGKIKKLTSECRI